eukprot:1161164-Pelagomonas_calceolata.AAC.4
MGGSFLNARGRMASVFFFYVCRGNFPYVNQGKGDTLAQKSHEPPPPQRCKIKSANGDLEGMPYSVKAKKMFYELSKTLFMYT